MNAIEQITQACGNYIGIAERGQTALGCLESVGIPELVALGIVANQLAMDVEHQDEKQVAYWKSACDYMPRDTAQRLHERKEISKRLRAMYSVPAQQALADDGFEDSEIPL